MKSSQAALVQRDLVVESDQFHQHAGDQHDQVTGLDFLVSRRQNFDVGPGGPPPLGL